LEDGKDDKTRMMPGPGKGEPSSGGDVPSPNEQDDATRVLGGAQPDDATRLGGRAPRRPTTPPARPPSTDDATRVMPSGDSDDATRVMPGDDDDSTRVMGGPQANDDATRVMGGDTDTGDATHVMPGQDAGDGTTRVADDDGTRVMGLQTDDGTQVMGADDRTLADVQTMARVSASEYADQTIVNNRFVLEKLLGAGGMGSVYKAKDLRKVEAQDRNPYLALKLLNEDFKQHPLAFMSLQREARKSQVLAHPNIVQVFDFDRDGEMVYMTMELLQGKDLTEFIKENPDGIDVDEATRMMRAMAAALQHAHNNNITHADFKPGNVYLHENGTVKVLDFGIAQAVAHADVGSTNDDKTVFDPSSLGALTPAYASLEMLQGKDPLPTDDLYALGCIVYQLLSGKHPYERMPADVALEKGKLAERIDKLNRSQWRALQKAIALKREDRYEHVDDFQREFAPEVNPWARWLGIAIGIAVVVGGAGLYQGYNETADVRAREAKIEEERLAVEAARQASEAERQAGMLIDDHFSGLREAADGLQRGLADRRFSFTGNAEWKQGTNESIAELRDVYRELDINAIVAPAGDLATESMAKLVDGAEQRREAAAENVEGWIGGYERNVAKDYLQLAGELAAAEQFVDAEAAIKEAAALDPDSDGLLPARRNLETAVAANREENQRIAAEARVAAQEQARLRLASDFAATDAAIQADLMSCSRTLSRTGRGGSFSYDINGLARQVNDLRARFADLGSEVSTKVDTYIGELGNCIQVYGYADPSAAKEQMALAKRSFPSYAATLSALSILPWDACKTSFAGRGERYDCQDRFLGKSDKGPTLVVIPAGGGQPTFAIGKYEVSQGEFDAYCQATNDCSAAGGDAGLPATERTTQQVLGYIAWLSEATGFRYQLPTRAQWAYAANAQGTGLDQGRNCKLESRGITKGQVMLPVDLGSNNGWGLVHHVGNARELVRDSGALGAAGGSRVDPMDNCTTETYAPAASGGDSYTGFRVVRTRE